MASLEDLLPVQELDIRAMQLHHRRENLEQRAELVSLHESAAAQRGVIDDIEARLHAIRRSQKEAEDHASLIEDRATAIDASMYDGSVTDPKELGSLQAELAQLRSNQDNVETRALELMEEADPIEAELDAARAEARAIDDRISAISDQIVVAEAELDAELDAVAADRGSAVEGIDAAMLELYESLRGLPGGVAIARMEGRRCGGCHLEIPSAQAEAIRGATDPRDSVCPECGCLLVV